MCMRRPRSTVKGKTIQVFFWRWGGGGGGSRIKMTGMLVISFSPAGCK